MFSLISFAALRVPILQRRLTALPLPWAEGPRGLTGREAERCCGHACSSLPPSLSSNVTAAPAAAARILGLGLRSLLALATMPLY